MRESDDLPMTIVVIIVFLIVFLMGFAVCKSNSISEKDCVSHNAAYYDSQTGEFNWKEQSK